MVKLFYLIRSRHDLKPITTATAKPAAKIARIILFSEALNQRKQPAALDKDVKAVEKMVTDII